MSLSRNLEYWKNLQRHKIMCPSSALLCGSYECLQSLHDNPNSFGVFTFLAIEYIFNQFFFRWKTRTIQEIQVLWVVACACVGMLHVTHECTQWVTEHLNASDTETMRSIVKHSPHFITYVVFGLYFHYSASPNTSILFNSICCASLSACSVLIRSISALLSFTR